MAGVLGRISTVFKAKMNAALDAAENPNETLDLSYEQQVEQLHRAAAGEVTLGLELDAGAGARRRHGDGDALRKRVQLPASGATPR